MNNNLTGFLIVVMALLSLLLFVALTPLVVGYTLWQMLLSGDH